MSKPLKELKPGEARCPAPSVQEIIRRDGVPFPDVLGSESYQFLGDQDMSVDRYVSQEYFDLEMEKLWPKTWQWVCREEHIPEPGDYIVYEIGRYSFLVVRTETGEIKAHYNSCLHRGTKLRPPESEGRAKELACPYHGWRYALSGEVKTVPCAWDFPKVKIGETKLPGAQVALWGGFVFINMDADAVPLLDYMGVIPEHFKNWDMKDRYVDLHIQKELPCNWKTAQEAFMEAYHTYETHPQLLNGVGDANTQYDVYGDHVSRFFAALGVSSPHLKQPLTEQQLVDQMLVGDRSVLDPELLKIAEGETARIVMARYLRRVLGEKYGTDLSAYSNSEIIDTIEYHLFPNMFLFPGISLPMVYRFRPIGQSPERTLFEILFLRPIPTDGKCPAPAVPVRVAEHESYAIAPGMDPAMGHIYDQDTDNLRMQQEGFSASKTGTEIFGNYQEVRNRHFLMIVDKYLGLAAKSV